jgi:hypothetical protein
MNVTAPPDKSRIFAHAVAVRLGEALLIGFAVVILFAGLDNAQRRGLETVQEVSSVGDRVYFRIPEERTSPPVAAVIFRGDQLLPVSYEPVKIRDTRMIRLGMDDSGQYAVYGSREGLSPENAGIGAQADKFLFLKVAPDEYLKTKSAPLAK